MDEVNRNTGIVLDTQDGDSQNQHFKIKVQQLN